MTRLHWSGQGLRDKSIWIINNFAPSLNTNIPIQISTIESFHWREKFYHNFWNVYLYFRNIYYLVLFYPLMVSTFVNSWVDWNQFMNRTISIFTPLSFEYSPKTHAIRDPQNNNVMLFGYFRRSPSPSITTV